MTFFGNKASRNEVGGLERNPKRRIEAKGNEMPSAGCETLYVL